MLALQIGRAKGVKVIKIGDLVFQVVNSGLEIKVNEKDYRFDPTESMTLLEYLDSHREDFQQARLPDQAEPAILSPEWTNQKLNEAFESMPD